MNVTFKYLKTCVERIRAMLKWFIKFIKLKLEKDPGLPISASLLSSASRPFLEFTPSAMSFIYPLCYQTRAEHFLLRFLSFFSPISPTVHQRVPSFFESILPASLGLDTGPIVSVIYAADRNPLSLQDNRFVRMLPVLRSANDPRQRRAREREALRDPSASLLYYSRQVSDLFPYSLHRH